jgi:hypothetical protein
MGIRNKVDLIGVAPVGFAISINGQRFDVVGHEPFTRQSGETVTAMVWQAECATCGEGFRAFSVPGQFAGVRRCEAHRQPGKPVTPVAVKLTGGA